LVGLDELRVLLLHLQELLHEFLEAGGIKDDKAEDREGRSG